MTKPKAVVFQDHTVKDGPQHTSEPVLPPGPSDPGDTDLKLDKTRRQPGFSNIPGAGPNPSQPNR